MENFQNHIFLGNVTFTKEIHKDLKIRGLGNFGPARTNLASVFQQDLVFMVIQWRQNLKKLRNFDLKIQKPKL